MNQYLMLVVLGLHSVTAGAYCSYGATDEDCRRIDAEGARMNYYSDKNRAEHEEYIQRTRPVQVIEPGGVRTFYPGTDGTWVTFDQPSRSRR